MGEVTQQEAEKWRYTIGPTLCRVERTYVDNELIQVTLEPVSPKQVVELGPEAEFVTVLSTVPLVPLSIWPDLS